MAQTYKQLQKQIEQLQRQADALRNTEVKGVIDRIKVAIAHYALTAAHLGLDSTSLKATGLTKLNEDIVVPRGRLEDLFQFAGRLQKKIHLPIACFGHAGDGNIHVNIMLDKTDPAAVRRGEAALDELFEKVIAWKGAITGEHGVGLAKKRWWPLAVSSEVRALHVALKQTLDPRGILNPGKFV